METGPRTRSRARKAEASAVKTPPTQPAATGGRSTRAKKSSKKNASTPQTDRTVTARSLEREFDERQDVAAQNDDQVASDTASAAATAQDIPMPEDKPDASKTAAEPQDTPDAPADAAADAPAAAETAVPDQADERAVAAEDSSAEATAPGADLLEMPDNSTEPQAAEPAAAEAEEAVTEQQQVDSEDAAAPEAVLPAAEQPAEEPAQQQQQQEEGEMADEELAADEDEPAEDHSSSPTAGWAAANAALAAEYEVLRGDTPVSIASAIGAARGFTPIAGFTPTPIPGLTPVGPNPTPATASAPGGPSPLQPFNLADALGLTPGSATLGASLLAKETPKELAFATSQEHKDAPTPEYMSFLSTPHQQPPTPVLGLITEPNAAAAAAVTKAPAPEVADAVMEEDVDEPADAAEGGEAAEELAMPADESMGGEAPAAGLPGAAGAEDGGDEAMEVAGQYEPLVEEPVGDVPDAGAAVGGDVPDSAVLAEQQAPLLAGGAAGSAAVGERGLAGEEAVAAPAVAAPPAEPEAQEQQPAGDTLDDLVAQLEGMAVKSPAPAALASAAEAAAGPATAPKSRAKSARIATPAPSARTPAGASLPAARSNSSSGHTPMVSDSASPGHTPWPAPKPRGRSPAAQAEATAAAARTAASSRSAGKSSAAPAAAAAAAPVSRASLIKSSAGSTPAAKKVAALTGKAPAAGKAGRTLGAGALDVHMASSGDSVGAAGLNRPKSTSPVTGLPAASRLLAPTQSSLAKARGPVQLESLPSSASAASVASAAAPKPRLRSLVVVPSPAKAEVAAPAAADADAVRGKGAAAVGEDKSIRSLRAEVRAKLEAKVARRAKKQQDQEQANKAVDMRTMRSAHGHDVDSDAEETGLSGALAGHDDEEEEVNQERSEKDQAVEDELVAAIGKMGIKTAGAADVPLRGMPAPQGRHMRFDDTGKATESPINKTLLRGVPVPQGKYKRWEL